MLDLYETFPSTSPRLALAPTFPDYVEDVVLAADAIQRVAIPAGARFVLFGFDADMRVKRKTAGATFALPTAGATVNGSGSELNPAARRLPAALADGTVPSHILLRAPTACRGSLSFYA